MVSWDLKLTATFVPVFYIMLIKIILFFIKQWGRVAGLLHSKLVMNSLDRTKVDHIWGHGRDTPLDIVEVIDRSKPLPVVSVSAHRFHCGFIFIYSESQ